MPGIVCFTVQNGDLSVSHFRMAICLFHSSERQHRSVTYGCGSCWLANRRYRCTKLIDVHFKSRDVTIVWNWVRLPLGVEIGDITTGVEGGDTTIARKWVSLPLCGTERPHQCMETGDAIVLYIMYKWVGNYCMELRAIIRSERRYYCPAVSDAYCEWRCYSSRVSDAAIALEEVTLP